MNLSFGAVLGEYLLLWGCFGGISPPLGLFWGNISFLGMVLGESLLLQGCFGEISPPLGLF